ncbi:hypothetical protein CLOP_g8892 [Closterium sp. NIES-67]|nr:hypothetical protein CLOP_g8892 [Closterium sp. NIES-67]
MRRLKPVRLPAHAVVVGMVVVAAAAAGGCARHRLHLSMDRPQVAAFASLLQRQQAQVASEAGVGDGDLLYSFKHTSNGFRRAPHPAPGVAPAAPSRRGVRAPQPRVPAADQRLAQVPGLPRKGVARRGRIEQGGRRHGGGIIDTGIWPEHPSFSDKGFSSNFPSGWKGKCEQSNSFRCNKQGDRRQGVLHRVSAGQRQARAGERLAHATRRGRAWHVVRGRGGGEPGGLQGGGQVSGMAPAARIAAYKVFWTDRSSGEMYADESDIIAAVNQGVADGVDVLSLSLGAWIPTTTISTTWLLCGPTLRGGGGYRTVDNFAPFFLTVGASTIARERP